MKQNLLTALVAALVASLVATLALLLVGNQSAESLGAQLGITRYPNSGIAARFLTISTTAGTATAGADGSFTVSGVTTLNGETTLGNCGTATFNPGAIATSTLAAATTTDIALPGAALGDVCLASLTSATSTFAQVTCNISGTATATLQLVNLDVTALDLATGTAKVCYFD